MGVSKLSFGDGTCHTCTAAITSNPTASHFKICITVDTDTKPVRNAVESDLEELCRDILASCQCENPSTETRDEVRNPPNEILRSAVDAVFRSINNRAFARSDERGFHLFWKTQDSEDFEAMFPGVKLCQNEEDETAWKCHDDGKYWSRSSGSRPLEVVTMGAGADRDAGVNNLPASGEKGGPSKGTDVSASESI